MYGLQAYYLSGENNFDNMYEEDIEAEMNKIYKKGAIMEFLEPRARMFNNIP